MHIENCAKSTTSLNDRFEVARISNIVIVRFVGSSITEVFSIETT